MRILNTVDQRIREELGWNTPNWRVENACRACCYKVVVYLMYLKFISNFSVAPGRAADALQSPVGA